jgi:hypothetical protein
MAVKAFVATLMFNWFVSPTFSVATVTFLPMLGITFLINLLFKLNLKDVVNEFEKTKGSKVTKGEKTHLLLSMPIAMFFFLGLAYVVTLFIK